MSKDSNLITVNMHEAKTGLSRLVQQVLDGKQVRIARHGKPVVELQPVQKTPKRQPGTLKCKIRIADDFDACAPEIQDLIENASAGQPEPQ
ncbi:MAG: type II toxin-antitoxin system prevent-host-death family antitoxin [Candidatus Cyclonatronum sp.]|uniref:type II toxin-antitoxin system Phd/YefM family antitoxin n=1 Tax=Cyclonatronum sp. TaxID=3024185 RepID=UPI0025BB2AD3|nr:type II toxin-antitoxin system prevent-host-death family antitoxin [Cyclonatronum sp.]MCH8487866.1 type II toxin-antitoxin system prevent-host-death family antitoxin [Cyclonatronum sp.]